MNTKFVWTFFLTALILCAAYFIIDAVNKINDYYSRTEWAMPKRMELTTKEIRSNRYIPEALYEYSINDKEYLGKEDLLDHPYMREESLELDLTHIANKSIWKVWYNPKKPWISSLYRTYPIKEILYAVIMVGLMAYFFFLKRYANN